MLKILSLLMIVSVPTHVVYHHYGFLLSAVVAAVAGMLTTVVYDFIRCTRGTFKWRWRSFDFKDEFTNKYAYREAAYLASVSWICVVMGERIVHWIGI